MTDADRILERIAAVEAHLAAELKRLDQADVGADKAAELLRETIRERFRQVNDFRGALDDLSKTMATRRELDLFKDQYAEAHEQLRAQTLELGRRLDLNAGKAAGVNQTTKVLVTGLSTVLVLLGIYTAVEATKHANVRPAVVTTTVEEHDITVTTQVP